MIKNLIKNLINKIAPKKDKVIGDMNFLLNQLKNNGFICNTIVDVGANKCNWAKLAINIFNDAEIYLFEPQQEMLIYLDDFIKKNHNSKYFLVGLGAEEKQLILTIDDDLAGSSFLPSLHLMEVNNNNHRLISINKLDNYFDNINLNKPNLIKIDIQGYELEALKGSKEVLKTAEVVILEVTLLELNDIPNAPTFLEIYNFMFEIGYVIYDFPGFIRRPLDLALAQCDICFIKKESKLRINKNWD
jgi:FkbM family methyltransferase